MWLDFVEGELFSSAYFSHSVGHARVTAQTPKAEQARENKA
jgi:hypothetical protein